MVDGDCVILYEHGFDWEKCCCGLDEVGNEFSYVNILGLVWVCMYNIYNIYKKYYIVWDWVWVGMYNIYNI